MRGRKIQIVAPTCHTFLTENKQLKVSNCLVSIQICSLRSLPLWRVFFLFWGGFSDSVLVCRGAAWAFLLFMVWPHSVSDPYSVMKQRPCTFSSSCFSPCSPWRWAPLICFGLFQMCRVSARFFTSHRFVYRSCLGVARCFVRRFLPSAFASDFTSLPRLVSDWPRVTAESLHRPSMLQIQALKSTERFVCSDCSQCSKHSPCHSPYDLRPHPEKVAGSSVLGGECGYIELVKRNLSIWWTTAINSKGGWVYLDDCGCRCFSEYPASHMTRDFLIVCSCVSMTNMWYQVTLFIDLTTKAKQSSAPWIWGLPTHIPTHYEI